MREQRPAPTTKSDRWSHIVLALAFVLALFTYGMHRDPLAGLLASVFFIRGIHILRPLLHPLLLSLLHSREAGTVKTKRLRTLFVFAVACLCLAVAVDASRFPAAQVRQKVELALRADYEKCVVEESTLVKLPPGSEELLYIRLKNLSEDALRRRAESICWRLLLDASATIEYMGGGRWYVGRSVWSGDPDAAVVAELGPWTFNENPGQLVPQTGRRLAAYPKWILTTSH